MIRITAIARLGIAAIAGLACAMPAAADGQPPDGMVAPFVSTPTQVVDAMLELARVGPNDVVVDLGSGDGRLVIAAVAKFGARGGFGVDIDATLVDYATRKAQEAGVADRVKFYVRDLFDTDIRGATVVTVYLLPIAMNRLQDKLLGELPPGTRVVSHDYPFRGWPSDRVVSLDVPEKSDYTGRRSTSLYLYTVPARAVR
ncbi:MAG: methyltransferase domain-containing protein [Burkholderiales bacterium]